MAPTTNARERRPGRLALAGMLWLTASIALGAPGATPLKVKVTIEKTIDSSTEESTLSKLWGTNVPTIEQNAAKLVAAKIGTMFRDWDFNEAPPRNFATLRLRFVEFADAPQTVYLELEQYPGDKQEQAEQIWRLEWIHPGDVPIGNVPPRTQAAQAILATLSGMEADKKQLIQTWLQKEVPIGAGGKWLDQPTPPSVSDLRLAAALPAARFTELTNAKLRVQCKSPQAGSAAIDLKMKGTADLHDTEVVLRPDWDAQNAPALPTLLGYRIGVIYLLERGRATDEEFFNVSP